MRLSATKLLLPAILALAGLAWPASAPAQRCTQGYDIGLKEDRNPSLCSFFALPGGEAGRPITAGPDGALWFFVSDHGAFVSKMTTSGQTQRFAMPAGPMPNALTAGPDGNVWYAGDGRIGRVTSGGQVTEYPIPALHATGIVAGPDGALWVAGGSLVVRVTPQGGVSIVPLVGIPSVAGGSLLALPPLGTLLAGANQLVNQLAGSVRGESHGIAVGGDGALWIAGGPSLARVTRDGHVSRVPVPGDLPADGGITAAADGSLWYSSSPAAAVGRVDLGGQVARYGLQGHPVDLVRGPGSANLWISTQNAGGGSWITRMATRSFGPSRPSGWGCGDQNPAACWFRIQTVPTGDTRLFNAHGTPGGVTVGPDGNVWYTEGGRIGRIIPFRGALPCYQRVTRNHNFGCGFELSHTGVVTHSGAAYLRTSCPYLTFRVCHGSVVLKLRSGRTVSRASYILAAYDTPRVRVPLPRWMLKQLKRHRRVKVDATYTSEDMGGIPKATSGIWFLTLRPDRNAG